MATQTGKHQNRETPVVISNITRVNEGSDRKICVIYTGGTIGMTRSENGYAPQKGFLGEVMSTMDSLRSVGMPEFFLLEYDELLDSSNIGPSDWKLIAKDIHEQYDEFDGFVVLHGTDTMAYTASALSFMLENLSKSVIITGAMIPICEVRSDARENLITSILLAASANIPEVCLYFHGKLYRGNRSTKVSSVNLDAFDSPNYPPLAEIGVGITVYEERMLSVGRGPFRVHHLSEALIGAIKLFPGITGTMIRSMLKPPLQAVVLESYGAGNAPNDPELLDAVKEACDRGVVIVNVSQCLRGTVMMGAYATGAGLGRAGVISGLDITPEAALAKLMFLFGQKYSAAKVRQLMGTNLVGELKPLCRQPLVQKKTFAFEQFAFSETKSPSLLE